MCASGSSAAEAGKGAAQEGAQGAGEEGPREAGGGQDAEAKVRANDFSI